MAGDLTECRIWLVRRTQTTALIAAVLAAGVAAAQDSNGLSIDVADCIVLESPVERFACYESRANAALSERSANAGAAEELDSETVSAEDPAGNESRSAARGEGRSATETAPAVPAAGPAEPETRGGADERETRAAVRTRDRSLDARGRQDDGARQEFFGTIAALRETVPNAYLITLEDGQVWRQMRAQWYPLQVGYRVRIYPTNWGNAFRMSAEELKGFIQVERVR